jgi:ATP-dependent Clp protease ATP-binding subunit ClpX
MTKRPMGLLTEKKETEQSVIEKLGGIEPEDLTKFGLIPEFIGRLPVNAMLSELDEAALIQILTEPKNALTKQYQKLFEYEGIELEFETEALKEVARQALERRTGARGLRAILEQTMLDVMYDIPSNDKVCKVIVTFESIKGAKSPTVVEGPKKSFTPTPTAAVNAKKTVESA